MGKLAYFLSNDSKALARFSSARCLNTGIERQEVGLERDFIDHANDLDNLPRRILDPAHRGHRIADHVAGLVGTAASIPNKITGLAGSQRGRLHIGGDFLQSRGCLLQ